MNHLYGSRATQSILHGGNIRKDIQDSITIPYTDRNMFKLCNETLGREIGKEVDAKQIDNKDNLEGGNYEPPKSYASIISEFINNNLQGGARKKGGAAAKSDADSINKNNVTKTSKVFSTMESVAYDETIPEKYKADLITFITLYLIWYKLYRSPSSALLVIPPHTELTKMAKKVNDYCKEKKIEKNSVEYESALASDTFQEWRNYLFYVYIPGTDFEYRIDPLQNGDSNSFPNNLKSVTGVKFRRANLNSYIWFLLYDNDDEKFYLYPTSDCKKADRIGLNFIAVVKHGKYIFQADSPIPNNAANKVRLNNKTSNQLMDVFIGAGNFKKYPISNLVEKWQNNGLELGSEMALCEMYKTNKKQVLNNLSSNLTHSAILSALDNINPAETDADEMPGLVKEMLSQYKIQKFNMKGGNIRLDKHSNIKTVYNTIKNQYPNDTRTNIIKADIMSALINKGMEPDLAFSAIDYSTRNDDAKNIINAVNESPFEYYNSKEHMPIFAINDNNNENDNVASISKIYENSKQASNETSNNEPKNETFEDESQSSDDDESKDELNGGELDLSESDSSDDDSEDELTVKQNDVQQNESIETEQKTESNETEQNETQQNETQQNETQQNVEGGSKKHRKVKKNKKSEECSKKAKVNFNKWF